MKIPRSELPNTKPRKTPVKPGLDPKAVHAKHKQEALEIMRRNARNQRGAL